MGNKWTQNQLSELRASVEGRMSPKRFLHTLAVEEMTERLGELFECEKIQEMRVAAILHDLTKEYPVEAHLQILETSGACVDKNARMSPKTLHAMTAAAIIPDEFPDFADQTVIGCVRWHTTGHANMTLAEQLVYLADYIDMTRHFPDCVRLRNYFFDAQPENMSRDEKMNHLYRTLLLSYDMTVRSLVDDGAIISADTVIARNEIVAILRSND